MDQFYLENAALYQSLLAKAAKKQPVSKPGRDGTKPTNPDMVIAARVRPLLEEDTATGFPCAVFPRLDGTGVVDIHDLYNHPKGRPILKVRCYA